MKPSLKWTAIGLGSAIAVAHLGILGHLLNRETNNVVQVPTINIPHGPYSSYQIEAGENGYRIQFRADDPKILESERSLGLDKERKGLFGGGREQRSEYRTDQFTREGVRNLGGAIDDEGKSAIDAECLVADAGAQSQGAMAGTSIAAGVVVPAVASIPYVGWLASGWALLLGQNLGEAAGSYVNSAITDC